jgi:TRAP transporter TAXI family solute receptor
MASTIAGRRRLLARVVPMVVIFTLVAVAAFQFVGPPCPKRLVIATGSPEGLYYHYGKRYAELLAEQGIQVEVRATAGSIENLGLLNSADSGVSLAIVQGGAESADEANRCVSLCSLYLEPLWVFHRGDCRLDRLSDLRGARIAVGGEGSGSRSLAMKLLEANGMLSRDPGSPAVRLVPLGGQRAVEALKAGQVDAAMFVISAESRLVRELFEAPGIHLLSLRRCDGYLPKYRFLSVVTLHEGVLDLKADIPARKARLLAPNANLAARADIHPALIPLLLQTARKVHRPGGTLEAPGVYPSPDHACLPLHRAARRYFESGPSLLFRFLPFRLAAWLDRMKILLLPLGTLLLPLLKTVPPIYRWRIRHKIYRWYRVLRDVDIKLQTADGHTDFSVDIAKLDRLDVELAEVSIPLSYMEEFYNLRLHVSFMLDRLQKRAGQAAAVRRAA